MLSFFLFAYPYENSCISSKKPHQSERKKIKKEDINGLFIVLMSLFMFVVNSKSSIARSSPSDSTTQLNSFVSSPQKSVHSFIHWQQKGHVIPNRFIQPFALFEW